MTELKVYRNALYSQNLCKKLSFCSCLVFDLVVMTAKKTVIILREMLETVFEMFCIEGETYSLNAAEPSNKKSYLSNRHSQSQVINEHFSFNLSMLVTMFPPKALIHFLHRNTHRSHNSFIRSDEGLTLETSALKPLTMANLR